jgi:ADP-ribose pyrophosphatase YjhB (NUDIX family)
MACVTSCSLSPMRDQAHLFALKVFGVLPKRVQNRAVRVLSPTYTVGTAVVITTPDQQLLLVQQSYTQGWLLPGGLLDPNELPAHAAAREIREELGLELAIDGHPIAVQTPWRRHYNFLFTAEIDHVPPAALLGHTPEISDAAWFDLNALPADLSEFTDVFLVATNTIAELP